MVLGRALVLAYFSKVQSCKDAITLYWLNGQFIWCKNSPIPLPLQFFQIMGSDTNISFVDVVRAVGHIAPLHPTPLHEWVK